MGRIILPDRRRFLQGGLALAGLGLVSGCGVLPSPAPRPARPARVGLLSPYSLEPSPESATFRQALRDLGYRDGREVTVVPRWGSSPQGLAQAAAELVGLAPDVLVTVGDEVAAAAGGATAAIPIVMADSGDPVGAGLVASLARPGGNVTGLSSLGATLSPKRLELLRATVPEASRLAVVWVAITEGAPDLRELRAAGAALGVRLEPLILGNPVNLAGQLHGLAAEVRGAIVLTDTWTRSVPEQVAPALNAARLPAVYEASAFVQAGGLLAYGPSLPDQFRRAATYVDRILRGAKPADLPVERPTRFDAAVNVRTARALGLTIPQAVMLQATEVIQ